MHEVSLDAYHAGRHYCTLFLPLLLGRANVWQTLGQRSADVLLGAFKPCPKQTGTRSRLPFHASLPLTLLLTLVLCRDVVEM